MADLPDLLALAERLYNLSKPTSIGEVASALRAAHAEIERLQRTLNNHLESESAETMRANRHKAERDAALAQAQEARRDADRLDTLECLADGPRDVQILRPPGEHTGGIDKWTLVAIKTRNGFDVREYEGKTLRAAIDRAIAEGRRDAS
jgi:hypothetical protein